MTFGKLPSLPKFDAFEKPLKLEGASAAEPPSPSVKLPAYSHLSVDGPLHKLALHLAELGKVHLPK